MMQIRLLVPQFHNVVPLDLEVYLQQVVPSEMPPDWPEQALLAQAIVCRSYALYAMLHPRHSTEGADVCTGVHCQVFNVDRRQAATDHAVLATQRQVLAYQGKVVDAVFSACCGGHTRDNEQVWKRGEPLPYLRGVECPCDGQKQRGHGVGMCQEGARVLAAVGKSAEEILKHYYGDQVEIVPMGEVIKAVDKK